MVPAPVDPPAAFTSLRWGQDQVFAFPLDKTINPENEVMGINLFVRRRRRPSFGEAKEMNIYLFPGFVFDLSGLFLTKAAETVFHRSTIHQVRTHGGSGILK
jgi:hypothetical protein